MSSSERPQFTGALLHPRYWLTWCAFGLWWLCAQLPLSIQLASGRALGRLLYALAKRRRSVAARNLELCLTGLDQAARAQLLKCNFEAMGMAVFETGCAWFWPKWRLDRIAQVEGLEHLEAARARGEGVVLMAFHFTHIDIGAKLLGRSFSIDGSYRPHNNRVYDYLQHRGRERHSAGGAALPRGDVRGMVKALRAGRAIWYAPDQDYGPKHSVFVPFFGVPAATVTATAELARLGKAVVIPFVQRREGNGYRLRIDPPLTAFPSGDALADAARINAIVETQILEQPDHYLWVHRRFKTRPPGEPDLYRTQ